MSVHCVTVYEHGDIDEDSIFLFILFVSVFFQTSVVKPKPITDADSTTNQSECKENACNKAIRAGKRM